MPATAREEMSAPAQMGPLARLGNIFFAPGEVFEDVRRSPRDWWLPLVVLLVVTTAIQFVIQNRFDLTPAKVADAAMEAQLERQGKTIDDFSDEQKAQIEKQKSVSETFIRFGPIVGGVWYLIFFAAGAGLYMLGLMLFQARTTYFRALSVVTYSNFATGVVQALLNLILAFAHSPDDFDLKSFLVKRGFLTASPAAFVSVTDHPVLYTFFTYFDLFSLGYLVLAVIGLSLVCVKKVKTSTAAIVVVVPYVLWMLVTLVFVSLTAR
jgi:hypothetical protein